MQIVRLRFLSHGYKRSVLWLLKYAKIRFRSGFRPGPRWGSSRHSSRPPSRLERGHPSSYPTPLGTDPPSALVMCPPSIPARSTPMSGSRPQGRSRKKCIDNIREDCSRYRRHTLIDATRSAKDGNQWRNVVHNLGCQRARILSSLPRHTKSSMSSSGPPTLVYCHS